MGETQSKKPHAIVFPYPYQGHITPTIKLVTNLASKGFTITYVQLEFIHQTISKSRGGSDDDDATADIFDEARKTGLDIRYVTISDGFPVDFDRELDEYWDSMFTDFPGRVDELVGRLITMEADDGDHKAASDFFLIADSSYSWPASIALKHKLVNVSFWTQPALVFSISYHLDLLRKNGHLPYKGDSAADSIDYIPGVESFSTKDLMSFLKDPDDVPFLIKVTVKAFEQVKNADFILCNTVEELESDCLLALNQIQPIYAIGPINFFTDIISTKTIVQKSLWAESDCTDWLKSKSPGSVLYISFGSIAEINKHEIQEIAHALIALSQVHFIWVMRNITSTHDVIFPVGFEEVLKERGLLVQWCDQNAVLSDLSVGGFLTHCGWNSILESVWNCVPMICYPFYVDQTTNRKLVVDDWKIGVNLCDGSGQVSRNEVVSKIDMLMNGKTCNEFIREKIKKVSEIMRNALDTYDGSSQRNFDQFVRDLKAGLRARKN